MSSDVVAVGRLLHAQRVCSSICATTGSIPCCDAGLSSADRRIDQVALHGTTREVATVTAGSPGPGTTPCLTGRLTGGPAEACQHPAKRGQGREDPVIGSVAEKTCGVLRAGFLLGVGGQDTS